MWRALVFALGGLAGCDAVLGLGNDHGGLELLDASDAGDGGDGGEAGTVPAEAGVAPDATVEGGSCVASGSGVVAVLGCPCSTPAALACAGNAQAQALVCESGHWSARVTCPSGQYCSTAPGADQGTCLPVDPACSGARPGSRVCAAGSAVSVVTCGADLVSETPVETCQNQTCIGGACSGTCTAGSPCGCPNAQQVSGSCDSTGNCVSSCGAYACGATQCNTSCASDKDCAAGHFCWSGACVRVEHIAASNTHTCALLTGGRVQCWGSDDDGELGDNGAVEKAIGGHASDGPIAVALANGAAATSIAAGYATSCVVTTAGAAQCWGDDLSGQLGIGPGRPMNPPSVVPNVSGVVAIAAGDNHTCALTDGGIVSCWGDDQLAQVNGRPGPIYDASTSAGVLDGAVALAAGGTQTCAIGSGGTVWCWGNDAGISTVIASGGTAVAVGTHHACAIVAGAVECWGDDTLGQLGNCPRGSDGGAVTVPAISGAIAIAAGLAHTCVVTDAGVVECWGDDDGGAGGTCPKQMVVPGVSGATEVAAGSAHGCALTAAGTVLCWGQNNYHQLGNRAVDADGGGSDGSPVPVSEP